PYLSDDASADDAEPRLQPRDRAAQHPSPTLVGPACYYRWVGGFSRDGGEFVAFRFTTAGESHGRGLGGVLEGVAAGLAVPGGRRDAAVQRRVGGQGRGASVHGEE